MFREIALIVLIVSILVGVSLKIILWKRRENVDGFHGYIAEEPTITESETDDWKSL